MWEVWVQCSSLELEDRHLNTDWDLPKFQDRQSRKATLAIAYKDNLDPQPTHQEHRKFVHQKLYSNKWEGQNHQDNSHICLFTDS